MATRVQLRGDRGLATRGSAGASTVQGYPFVATGTITSTAAGTAVTLKSDVEIPAGSQVWVTAVQMLVNGATAWSGGSFTTLSIQDSNGTPVVFFNADAAALTGNAQLGFGTANTTGGAGVVTGGTAGKGLQIKGNANAGAGSAVIVTVSGMVK